MVCALPAATRVFLLRFAAQLRRTAVLPAQPYTLCVCLDLSITFPARVYLFIWQRARCSGHVARAVQCRLFTVPGFPTCATQAHNALHVVLPDMASLAATRKMKIDDFLAADGFHPAGEGCALLGDMLAETVEDTVE